MSLQLAVVERLFDRLIASYGNEFLSRYQGLDANKTKSAWSYELSSYANRLESIAWALENLPERAPNVFEFRNLCAKAPEKQTVFIGRPAADPEIVALIAKKLAATAPVIGRLDWAKKILENPEGRTPTVIRMAKDAMGAV